MLRKQTLVIIFLVAMPFTCWATIFTEDGTISSGYNETTEIKNSANVNMTGGNSPDVWIRDYGKLNFSGGTISSVHVYNAGTMYLIGSSFANIDLNNSAKFNLETGLVTGRVTNRDSSTININGGQVQQGRLEANQYSVTNLNGGNTTWDDFLLQDFAVSNIYNGTVQFDGAFSLRSFSTLNIFGGQIVRGIPAGVALYDSSILNIYGGGSSLLENGFSIFSSAAINVYYTSIIYDRHGYQIIGYNLRDGSEFLLSDFTQAEIAQINFVPEPATLALIGLGGLLVRKQ